ncbi:hypothetical protein EMPS_10086 [Entomortierella parvispora]|uniref:F-box domain-containing protein n=1 Tax=Entomortierella parvispora TaxID=205924 RepID=A0A9P3HJD4_9FUNG|nr:hypothetical protein EMPS_10086 [Entomortierella parvispora]
MSSPSSSPSSPSSSSSSSSSSGAPSAQGVIAAVRPVRFSPESLGRLALLPTEVYGLIADHLSTVDLASCVSVNHSFRDIWIDYLFRDMSLVEERQIELFELSAVTTFKRHCRLTRSFVGSRFVELGAILRYSGCTSLRYLDLRLPRVEPFNTRAVLELLGAVLRTNSCLNHVACTGRLDWTAVLDLLSSSISISSLYLNFVGAELAEAPSRSGAESSALTRKLPALKQLSLDFLPGSSSGYLVLLRECSQLEAIRWSLVGPWDPSDQVKEELLVLLKNVESLAWEASEIDEEELGEMLALGTETKRVAISAPIVRSFAPVLKRAASFKSLTLDGVLGSFSSQLQLFLERATALEELCALPLEIVENNHIGLLARNFHDKTDRAEEVLDGVDRSAWRWGCARTLTCLEVLIERRYPTYEDGTSTATEGQAVPLSVECRLEHAIAYEQLSQLVNLRHLKLGQTMAPRFVGGEEERGGYQTNCLLFSMESGLSSLHGMRAIHTLDVRWIAHEIGRQELEWMHNNFPTLSVVVGITDFPPHADRLWRRRAAAAEEWMDAHPRGVGRDLYEQ